MKKEKKLVKKKKESTPFWNEMVAIHFDFCRTHFNTKPVFDGSAPRDLKYIVMALKKRAEEEGIEWTLKAASERLGNYFLAAYHHKDSSGKHWLREHWLLLNLNRQKEIIFFTKKNKQQDVGSKESERNINSTTTNEVVKPSGSFGKL